MPLEFVADDSGETMKLLEIDGKYYPVINRPGYNQEEEIRAMDSFEARDDDILICAYPKSGTHWVWEIVKMLVNRRAERIPTIKESSMLEFSSRNCLQERESPRVLNTHMLFKDLPTDFKNKKTKIIYILRNPKDVAVSFFNHHKKLLEYEYSGSWKAYLNRFIYGKVDFGSWFDYVTKWEEAIDLNSANNPIHSTTYEDLQKNATHEIQRLATFLGIECSDELCQDISTLCCFKSMKTDKILLENPSEWRNGEPEMYRKGCVGDWVNWFTVAQDEMFNAVFEQKMANSKIKPVYTLQA